MLAGKKIVVLGAGNLGGALIEGLLQAGVVAARNVTATVRSQERAEALAARLPVRVTAGGNVEAAAGADVIVLGVKPPKITEVAREIRSALRDETIVVSLAAAVSLERIEQALAKRVPVFRAMPNLAMTVRQSATALCCNKHANDDHRRIVEQLFTTVGAVVFVEEPLMHAVTALSGSGPAYVYYVIEALTAAGARLGLPEEIAARLALQTVLGAATLACNTETPPPELRRRVTTPGGTTAAAVAILEQRQTRQAWVDALEAAAQRSREIAAALEG
jgi:pyrroline-5-carboxylate reductase